MPQHSIHWQIQDFGWGGELLTGGLSVGDEGRKPLNNDEGLGRAITPWPPLDPPMILNTLEVHLN